MKFSFEAVKIAVRQDRHGYVLNLSVHPDDIPDALLRSPVGTRYAVAMVEWDSIEGEVVVAPVEPPKAPVTPHGKRLLRQAGALCKEEKFQNWIGTFTEVAAAAALRHELGIDSRSDLEHNEDAQHKFVALVEQYNNRES